MEPVASRVRLALTRKKVPRTELLALLGDMLDELLTLMMGEDRPESWRVLISRAEIEHADALDIIHETMTRQVVDPCCALVGRLLGRPAKQDIVYLRTLAVIGQVFVFCHKGPRQVVGGMRLNGSRLRLIRALVRAQTAAIFAKARAA
jgi:hypothetical protein